MEPFNALESNVRTYPRAFPNLFTTAKGAHLRTADGKVYIDFLASAGSVNYGHNNDFIKGRVLEYMKGDGIVQGLDFHTPAKAEFIRKFQVEILAPRNLNYKFQFCGPTGSNAVEAALKLARKVKRRNTVISFMGGFHGMTQGSMGITSIRHVRPWDTGGGNTHFIPYPEGEGHWRESIDYLERLLEDDHSGVGLPAAVIFETIQAEGGINVAPSAWIRRLAELCTSKDILLICDDIQMGCFRTGTYFSFEHAGIAPDIVLLSKSLSGFGGPMALLLMKPEIDIWAPGEHTGTFRGFQPAFVGASAALDFIRETRLAESIRPKAAFLLKFLQEKIITLDSGLKVRGRGMVWGIDTSGVGKDDFAEAVAWECYLNGLILERAGRKGAVLKILPPLIIDLATLETGCEILLNGLTSKLTRFETGYHYNRG